MNYASATQNVLRVPSQMVETGQSAPSAMLCCPIAPDLMGPPMLTIVVRGKQLLELYLASVGSWAGQALLKHLF